LNLEQDCREFVSIPDFDRNAYSMTLEFYVVNTPTELVTLDVMLERLR
jgi:hypothetical protein